jgi:hypothetical protein
MNEKLHQTISRGDAQPGDGGDLMATGPAPGGISSPEPQAGSRWNPTRRLEHGQSMVEIAFVLPLFLALIFSIIEIGRAWVARQSLVIAAREGARILVLPYGAGLTYTTESDVQTAALNTAQASLDSSGTVATSSTQIVLLRIKPGNNGIFDNTYPNDDQIEENYTGAVRGERIGIRINYPFETPLPIILGMFNHGGSTQNAIVMSVTCYMDHE